MKKTDRIIYLDHAATTPVRAEVFEAMKPYLQERFGNPGGIYSMAVDAKKALTQARRDIAACIGADAGEIFFTSGGTEADNWAVSGSVFHVLEAGTFCRGNRDAGAVGGPAVFSSGAVPHVVASAFEHHAVLETCAFLERLGVEVTYLRPDKEGLISCDALRKAMRPETVLVSIMMANNEIGTIQPIGELASAAHENGSLFHTDAVQAAGHIKVDVKELGIDMMSVSGHKFGGPKGIGFLYVKQGIMPEPLMHGGGQERGRRAGTENVAAVVGMAKALQISLAEAEDAADGLPGTTGAAVSPVGLSGGGQAAASPVGLSGGEQAAVSSVSLSGGEQAAASSVSLSGGEQVAASSVRAMRDHLAERICNEIPGVLVNGSMEKRLPGNLNVGIEETESESVLLHLNRYGICASGGAACTTSLKGPSHVLRALGQTEEQARSAIRFTLGSDNTMEEIDYTADVLKEVVEKLREIRG